MNNDELKDAKLFKGSGFDTGNEDLTSLREQFKSKYCMSKGWDINNLSYEQITEIKSNKGYQCPGMICG